MAASHDLGHFAIGNIFVNSHDSGDTTPNISLDRYNYGVYLYVSVQNNVFSNNNTRALFWITRADHIITDPMLPVCLVRYNYRSNVTSMFGAV